MHLAEPEAYFSHVNHVWDVAVNLVKVEFVIELAETEAVTHIRDCFVFWWTLFVNGLDIALGRCASAKGEYYC